MTKKFDKLMDQFLKWLDEYGGYTIMDVMEDQKGFYIMVDYEEESGGSNPKKVRIPEKFDVCL